MHEDEPKTVDPRDARQQKAGCEVLELGCRIQWGGSGLKGLIRKNRDVGGFCTDEEIGLALFEESRSC